LLYATDDALSAPVAGRWWQAVGGRTLVAAIRAGRHDPV